MGLSLKSNKALTIPIMNPLQIPLYMYVSSQSCFTKSVEIAKFK